MEGFPEIVLGIVKRIIIPKKIQERLNRRPTGDPCAIGFPHPIRQDGDQARLCSQRANEVLLHLASADGHGASHIGAA